MFQTEIIEQDVVIIGAGGAGLRAALELADAKYNIAIISKVPVLKSHTIAAQGGINAPLGNYGADQADWFIYDTVKASDYLADQDAVEILCNEAEQVINDLAALAVPFTKDEQGQIYQRKYGGQTVNFGAALARRACGVGDQTGAEIMLKLHQAVLAKQNIKIYAEHFAIELLTDAQQISGVLIWDFASGKIKIFKTKYIIIASGGFAGLYKTNTAAQICTGDGLSLALRSGAMLKDMEFVQFHPTALSSNGVLISEAARGEGAYLTNNLGEKFMEQYAPKYRDLASRDVIARAIFNELKEGRGCGEAADHVHLNIAHLGKEIIDKYLSNLVSNSKLFAKIDPYQEPIPVRPAAHYTMGGIATDKNSRVIGLSGLYAIGEAACTSVHGANRLGCNSLLELMVFGKQAALAIKEDFKANDLVVQHEVSLKKFHDNFREIKSLADIAELKSALGKILEDYVGVVRDEASLQQALVEYNKLSAEIEQLTISDTNLKHNNELLALLELKNLNQLARIVIESALARQESRGAHYRSDHPQRDDQKFMQHSIYSDAVGLDFAEVRKITGRLAAKLKPEARKY